MLAAWPGACHESNNKAKINATTLTKKRSKLVDIVSLGLRFQLLALKHLKKYQKKPSGAEPPGPPGKCLAAKVAPRVAQEPPRAAQLPPNKSPDAFRTPFWPPRGSIFASPGADFGGLGRFFCRQALATKRLANKGWSAVLAEP